jgi:hypothetical protein
MRRQDAELSSGAVMNRSRHSPPARYASNGETVGEILVEGERHGSRSGEWR